MVRSPRRFARLPVLVVLAVVAGLIGYRTLGHPAEVLVITPTSGNSAQVYGLGTVEARTQSALGFEVTGRIVSLGVDQGDRVKAGQVLAHLDDTEQRARLAQAEAAVVQARAAIVQAQARIDRARAMSVQKRGVNARRQALVHNGTVSAEAAEDAKANSDVAGADLSVALADIEAARGALAATEASARREGAILEKFTLIAPYGGVIVDRARDLGTVVPAGTTVFTLVDPASVWVRAFVDESLAGPIEVGQKAEVHLRSDPGHQFAGRVARIDRVSDRVSEERLVNVAFDPVPDVFYLGEEAEALIGVRADNSTVLVPAAAVKAIAADQATVWTVTEGRLRRHSTRILRRFADGRFELAAMSAIEALVVSPVDGLAEGAPVRPRGAS